MAKTKNYYLIRRVKKNIREDLLEWIDGNTINAEDHATPWNVIDADKLRKFIDELLKPREPNVIITAYRRRMKGGKRKVVIVKTYLRVKPH